MELIILGRAQIWRPHRLALWFPIGKTWFFLEETLAPIGVNLVFLPETTVFLSKTLGNHGFRRQNTSSHRENVVFLRENMVLYGFP